MAMDAVERRNARKCVVGEGLFGTGIGFLSSVSVLPLLLKSLGASEIEIGLLGSIFWAGWVLLQPLGLLLFAQRRRTKRFLVPWSLACSVPTYLAMGLVVYFLGPTRPRLVSTLLLILLGVRVLSAGMVFPFWQEWQATIFRRDIRGRVIGLMAAVANLGATLSALAAAMVVDALVFPRNYSLLFGLSIVFFIVSLTFHASVREPAAMSAPYDGLRRRDLFRRFAHSLSEKNFRNYLIGRLLMTLGAGAAAFYAVHFKGAEGGGLPEATVIRLGALLGVALFLASYPLGRLGDRAGHKVGVVVGACAQMGAIGVAFLGRGAVACGVTFALAGVAWSAAWVSHMNMLFETCPHDSRVAHITLSNVVLGPMLWVVPVATGWAMTYVGMRTGIGLTLIPTLLGVAWLAIVVKEPRDIEITGTNPDTPAEA
ncbi:MAG: MFS transporter [Planctomycetota bacterium]|jgi:MFS family permease